MDQQMSVADMIRSAQSRYGESQAGIAAQIERSPRLVRKILAGQISGENYRTAVTELYTSGRVTTRTPRARTKSGQVRKVRAKASTGSKSAVPPDTRGMNAPKVPRGKFEEDTQLLQGGNRIHTVTGPKTKDSKGRKAFFDSVTADVRKTTRSQARADKRMKFQVTVQDSKTGERHTYQMGSKSGYHASDILADVRTQHGGSIESWMNQQVENIRAGGGSPEISMSQASIVGVSATTFQADRTKGTRREEDAAGIRRGPGSRYRFGGWK